MSNPTYLHCLPREILEDVYSKKVTKNAYVTGSDQILHINNTYIRLNKSMRILHAPGCKALPINAEETIDILNKRTGYLMFHYGVRCLVLDFAENTQFMGAVTFNNGYAYIDIYVYFNAYEREVIIDWLKEIYRHDSN